LANEWRERVELTQVARSTQDQFAVCLSISVSRHFARSGASLPLLISNPDLLVYPRGRQPLTKIIATAIENGLQIFVAVQRAADAAAVRDLRPTILELPPAPTPTPRSTGAQFSTLALVDPPTFRERPVAAAEEAIGDTPSIAANDAAHAEPIYRFPIQRTMRRERPSAGFDAMAGEATGDVLFPGSPVRVAGFCTPTQTAALEQVGIRTIGELLATSVDSLEKSLDSISPTDLGRWQAYGRLLLAVPGMAIEDAESLFACGISSPEQLEEVRGESLLKMLESALIAQGRRSEFSRYTVERINGWMRALARTRPSWSRWGTSLRMASGPTQPKRLRWSTAVDPAPTVADVNRFARPTSERADDVSEVMRYHLKPSDSVDAAPSIGPRVVEQFAKLGIRTVADLLSRPAAEIAAGMENRRIGEKAVAEWQQQARMASSVPNLRRHDAQILVACGICQPEQLAAMNPNELLDRVARFAQTKPGIRMFKTAAQPDLSEVANWIRWARQRTAVQAA
jgi:hypothetical protein